MTEKSPAFQFYPKDVLTDSRAMLLPNEIFGIYMKLLCHDWINDGIPDDNMKILTLGNYDWHGHDYQEENPKTHEQEAIKELRQFFIRHPSKDGFITNQRLIKEREKQEANRLNKISAGKKGAERRWHSHTSANSKSIIENSSSSSTSSSSSKNKTLSCQDLEKPKPRPDKFTSLDLEFAKKMFDQIIDEFPNLEKSYRKNYGKRVSGWANEIRKMREIDLKTMEQIEEIWEWARNDSFWKMNIQSGGSLREQFEKLTIRSNGSDPWDKVVREDI